MMGGSAGAPDRIFGKYVFQNDYGTSFYTYDKDSKNKSACDDKCAETWAPVKAHDKATAMGDWTLVDRGKGYMQWAYKGKPLYYFSDDTKPGDTMGQNAGKAWFVVQP